MLFGRRLCHIIDELRPKTENPFAIYFWFHLFLLILGLPDVSNKSYRGTGSAKFSAQHKVGLASAALENIVSSHGLDVA